MIAFGPIPSRRLGQSLGINNIPPKACSYNCLYCQVGPTPQTSIERQSFYPPEKVCLEVKERVKQVRAAGGKIDYLSIVPDGEPTLDRQLSRIIELLQPLSIKIAVITNGSLLWSEEVRRILTGAELVSLKIDSVEETAWRIINRPAPKLSLNKILEGALQLSREFQGELITETMLVRGINDHTGQLKATAGMLEKLNPSTAYIALPTRPPAESWVQAPDEQSLANAYQIFSRHLERVEVLAGYPADTFTVSGDSIQNLLDITAVHPMREREVLAFLEQAGIEASALEELVENKQLVRVIHEEEPFYVRKLQLN